MMGDPNNGSHWLCSDNNTHWLGLSICTGYYYYVFYLRYMVIMSSKHLNAQYNLRWPDDLKEKIAQSAKEHNRSMNADIVHRLEQSFINESLLPKILDDQIENSLETIQGFRGLLKVIKNLQEQVEKQNELLEELNNKKIP